MSTLSCPPLSKQDQLYLWMRQSGTTFVGLGRQMGISYVAVRSLLLKGKAPYYRVDQLRVAGVPDDLLPEPTYPPGCAPLTDHPLLPSLSTHL